MKTGRNNATGGRVAPLLGAIALHAIVVALGLARVPRSPPVRSSAPSQISELEVSLLEPDRAPHPDDRPPPLNATAQDSAREPAADARWGGARTALPSTEALAAAEPSPGERGARGYALDPAAGEPTTQGPQVDLGIDPGSWAKWGGFAGPVPLGEPATARAPRAVSSTGGLAEALDAADRKIGIGPSGAVLSAARDAATGSTAPQSGLAQFTVTVYRDGTVEVALLASSNDAAGWSSVGATMAATLKRKPPRISSNRRGVRIVVEVSAQERRASGGSAEGERRHTTVTPPALRSSEDAKAEIEKRSPGSAPPPGVPAEQRALAPIIDAPGVFVAGGGRSGQVAVGVGAFGEMDKGDPGDKVAGGAVVKGNIDVVDLVLRASRSVSTRVLRETTL